MKPTTQHDLEIFIDVLIADEELRDSFLRNPMQTLRRAGEWGLPLSDSEVNALRTTEPAVWERVAEELNERLQEAA